MIRLPSRLRVRILSPERDPCIRFDVLNDEEQIALRNGLVAARA